MSPVNPETGPNRVPVSERLAILLDAFSPWEGISLNYRQFAAELGGGVTEAAVKKWAHRAKFPADIAKVIVEKARDRGLADITLEWVLWGDGEGPKRRTKKVPSLPIPVPGGTLEQHQALASRIADALRADLGHNEFGQWSSVEVQRTVIWSLKDLARRLWVLRFPMSETFKLTDAWGTQIGLPSRSLASTGGPDDYSASSQGR